MSQQIAKNKPLYVVTDRSAKFLTENEALYLKNYRTTFNANKSEGAPVEGGNFGKGTPNRANKKYALITLPAGDNLTIGVYECEETNEIYFANWNSNNLHGWYRIDGVSLKPDIIVIDPKLNFSNDPAHKIPQHRVGLQVTYQRVSSSRRVIKEKALYYTDGNSWQGYINVEAAIATNGFDPVAYPYWALKPPHFDREEMLQLAVRPPMYAPEITPIPAVPEDFGKRKVFINKTIQLAYEYEMTDGRSTTPSPYSNPISLKESPCDINDSIVPRCFDVVLNAGSALVERIKIFQRECGGIWSLCDIINRFEVPAIAETAYWNRVDQWAKYSFDPATNTIHYKFCGEKQLAIIDPEEFTSYQSDLPLVSVALSTAGDSIILGDNLYGYNNLPKSDLDNFAASVVTSAGDALIPTRKISVYAYLALDGTNNQIIWGGKDDKKRFGGLLYEKVANNFVFPSEFDFDAAESDKFHADFGAFDNPSGFKAYLAGTSYSAISKQYIAMPDGTFVPYDVLDPKDTDRIRFLQIQMNFGAYVVHRFDFQVPPGKYIVRIARHNVDYKGEYQKYSTWVMGQVSKIKIDGYKGVNLTGTQSTEIGRINNRLDSLSKELEVDVCTQDWDSWNKPDNNIFYIYVPKTFYKNGDINNNWRFIEGVIYGNDDTKIPVEGISYISMRGHDGKPENLRYGKITDHNGFFFVYMADRNNTKNGQVVFSGVFNCGPFVDIVATSLREGKAASFYEDFSIKDNIGQFGDCNQIKIRGSVVNPISGIGYSGVGITSAGGPTVYTGSDGRFELAVHDGVSYGRKGKIYINAGTTAGCFLVSDTGSCLQILNYDLALSPCFNCKERIYPVNYEIKLTTTSQDAKSVKDGGSYGIGFSLHDLAGRSTFIQEINTVDVPSFMDNKSIYLPGLQVLILNDVIVSKELKWLTFFRTKELKNQKYLQWVGDKIEFLDKNGDVVVNGVGAIRARITIQSLLDFNKDNNFSTTANYQFSKGDILRFYDDGRGNLFDPSVNGQMDYKILGTNFNQTIPLGTVAVSTTDEATKTTTTVTTSKDVGGDTKTLIIPFDTRLLALNKIIDGNSENADPACGFWIELQTPREVAQIDGYCEILGTYPVLDGRIQAGTFKLDAFDTYYQNRGIHISDCSGKSIFHSFASSAVSDFFGAGCDSCGRRLVINKDAEQKWYKTDTIQSDISVNDGMVNGLGRFRDKNRKQFTGQETGGIVAMHTQNKVIVIICEDNWFMVNYDTKLIQVSPDGLIVPTSDDKIGDPLQRINNRYGCSFEDIGSVIINDMDGVVFWIDSKNEAIIAMDYRNAVDITSIDNKSYFTNKFTLIRQYNQLLPADKYVRNLFDKSMAFDYKMKELHVSFRPRNELNSDVQYFANTERGVLYTAPETFTFSLDQKRWTQFQTFVPEFYGTLRKSFTGNELISFVAGIPYFHNSIDVNTFNQFYGVSDSQVIEIPFTSGDKDKTFQSLIVQSPVMKYFVDRIRTNRPRMFSYIPASHWRRKNNSWYASVLRDMSSYPDTLHPVVSMLLDGGAKISGEYCIVRFVRDLERMDEYNEVDAIFMQFIGFEKAK